MKTHWKITILLPLFAALAGCLTKAEKEVLEISHSTIVDLDAVQSKSTTINIMSTVMWSIESSAEWLNVSPQKGFGDKEVDVLVSPNTSLSSRQASLFIIGEKLRREVKVTQKGETPVLTINENEKSVPSSASEVEVTVTGNVELTIVIDQSWVTHQETKTVSDSKYTFLVAKNEELTPRVAKIIFKQNNGTLSQEYTITQAGEDPDMKLSKSSVSVDYRGDMGEVTVTSNVPWTATPSKSWIKIVESMETKAMKDSTCLFLVEENDWALPREAIIVFSRKNSPTLELSRTLTVLQGAAPPAISFTPSDQVQIAASGTSGNQKYTVAVDANFEWGIDLINYPPAAWISEVAKEGNNCTFKVSANVVLTPRSTTIVFTQAGETFTKAYEVTQAGADPFLTVLPKQEDMAVIGGEGGAGVGKEVLVFVTSNIEWHFDVDASWLTVGRSVSPTIAQTEVLTCVAEENMNSHSRTAIVTISSELGDKVLLVTQAAGEPQMTKVLVNGEAVTTLAVSSQETDNYISVTANVPWTATADKEWIEIVEVPATKAPLSDSTVRVNIAKNPDFASRSGEIVIAEKGTGKKLGSVTVTQAALVRTITITPSATSISGVGGTLRLDVSANFEVALGPVDKNWVHCTDSISGNRYNFTAEPTVQLASRTATVTFKDIYSNYTQTVLVVQRGATVSVADSTVLVSLYNGLSGVVWNNRWTLSRPVSEWSGIGFFTGAYETQPDVINGELRVGEINLARVTLVGVLEDGLVVKRIPLENLTYLTKLDLSGNLGLGGVLPADLCKLTFLEELNLSGCNFSNEISTGRNIPEEWGGKDGNNNYYFTRLDVLKINGNSLSGTIPESIRDHPYWGNWNAAVNILPQRSGSLVVPPM